jgi:hypothetical protein
VKSRLSNVGCELSAVRCRYVPGSWSPAKRVSLLFMFGLHPLEIVIALSLIALLLAVSLRK